METQSPPGVRMRTRADSIWLGESADGFGRLARAGVQMIGMAQGLEEAELAFDAESKGQLDVIRADSAGRRVDDAKKGRIIRRIQKNRHVSGKILDLAPFEKAFPADEAIGNSILAKVFLKQPGLRVHAIDDREVFPGEVLLRAMSGELLNDELGLPAIVRHRNHPHGFSTLLGTPEILLAAARVVRDEPIGRGKNGVRAAIILLEPNDARIREVLFKFQDVRNFCAAPAVDALVVVAHDTDIWRLAAGKLADELELQDGWYPEIRPP